jgi:hypothetical protein
MEHAMSQRLRRFVWSCIVIGTLLRLALSFISFGSNDANGISGGLFLLLMYWASLVSDRLPLLTLLSPSPELPPAGGLFGFLAWWVLLTIAVVQVFVRAAPRAHPAPAS